MRLGAFYNFFDGEELLRASVQSIRSNVDYIVVVFQEISNIGNPCNPKNFDLLDELKDENLIDDYFLYDPKEKRTIAAHHEVNKRNAGLKNCLEKDCTHILAMDADEFYLEKQIKKAKVHIEEAAFDTSACRMFTYFKEPIYQIYPPENYYVPFIQKIDEDSRYILNNPYPVQVDPTRRISGPKNKFKSFGTAEVIMYHMSFVRRDIRSKLINSTARSNFKNVEKYIEFFNEWHPGVKNFHPVNPREFHDVREVKNIFNIDIWK